MALTFEEEQELQELETLEAGTAVTGAVVGGLTPEEETELAELEALETGALPAEVKPEAKPPGLGERLTERGKFIAEEAEAGVRELISPETPRIPGIIPTLPISERTFKAGTRIAGQAVGAAGEIAVEGIVGLANLIIPPKAPIRRIIKDIGSGINFILTAPEEQLDPVELVSKRGIEALRAGGEMYQSFKAENPEIAKDIEAALNIAAVIPTGKFAKAAVKETFDIVGDVKNVAGRKSVEQLNMKISSEVKGSLPRIVGRANIKGDIAKFDKKAVNAFENIINNKTELQYVDDFGRVTEGIPVNAEQTLSAIQQTKQSIFNQYNNLKITAGEGGAVFSTKNTIRNLEKLKKKLFVKRNPAIARSIDNQIDFFKKNPKLSLDDVQGDIANLNAKTKAFQQNPNPNLVNNNSVDMVVLDGYRTGLDDAIFKETGEIYSELKKAYGSLSEIDKGFASALKKIRVGRQGSAFDLTDVLGSGTSIYAIASTNPKLLAAAATASGLRKFAKWRSGTDRQIKGLFKSVDKLITKRENAGFNPKSRLGRVLKERTRKVEEAITPISEQQKLLPGAKPPLQIGFEPAPIPKVPFKGGKGKVIKIEKPVTGDPFIDEKISIALATPPALRDAEQKLIIDMLTK